MARLVVTDAAERATTGRLGERLTGGIEARERDHQAVVIHRASVPRRKGRPRRQ
jgi:hypothetical protein